MPIFEYRAVTRQGEVKTGRMSGHGQQDVVAKLQGMGLIPISAEAHTEAAPKSRLQFKLRKTRLGTREVTELTRQLAILLGAGLALDRALEIIRQVSGNPLLAELVEEVQEGVRGGQPLSESLKGRPHLFSDFYINFIHAAELSGNMAGSLEDLSRYLEKARALRENILSAMLYPTILIGVTLLSLAVIVVYVLPEFARLFEDMDATLPTSTAVVLGTAEFFQRYGLVIVVAAALLVYYIRRKREDQAWRYRWDTRILELPLFGDLTRKLDTARLSRSLGTLLAGGVPLLSALRIARKSIQNRVLAARLEEVTSTLQEGGGLAAPLMETGVYPEFALQMIQVGEETGKLDEMLIRVADIYDDEVATATQRLLSVLEPLLIISLGIIIGGIIMSILVAILGINELPV